MCFLQIFRLLLLFSVRRLSEAVEQCLICILLVFPSLRTADLAYQTVF